MPQPAKASKIKMGDVATYKIRVQGYLDKIWADRLANMQITVTMKENMIAESQLIGRVRDQAELIGVLNGLYEMRLPILFIEALRPEQEC